MYPIGTKLTFETDSEGNEGKLIKIEYRCKQCKKPMNPVDAMVNPICLSCTRINHKKATK